MELITLDIGLVVDADVPDNEIIDDVVVIKLDDEDEVLVVLDAQEQVDVVVEYEEHE